MTRAGNSKGATAERRKAFIQAYLGNGHNATQAAIRAGYSAKTAYSSGQRLLRSVEVSQELAVAAKELAKLTGLDAARTLKEVNRISMSDVRKIFREDGSVKSVAEMDDDTGAAIASVEVEEIEDESGVIKRITKVKFWDKNAALDKAMRHLGLFEKDNSQTLAPLSIKIELVGPA